MYILLPRLLFVPILFVALPLARAATADAAAPCDYTVVVSKRTHENPDWKKVVEVLVKKHSEKYHARVIEYAADVNESVEPLRKLFPRYAAFVVQPEDAGREFVVKVHRLTRKLDDDPYTDVVWGIITGYRADGALRIVNTSEPFVDQPRQARQGVLDSFASR